MPTKEKKPTETEDRDDEGEEKEPTAKEKSKRDAKTRQKSSEEKIESAETPTEKRQKSESVKEKKKKKKKEDVDYAEVYQEELLSYHTEESDDQEDEFNKKKVYEVVTITGDVKGAGTDANVFVTMYGEFGVTPKVHLASKSRTAFEKNKTDVFRIKTHNVGPIKKIRIEHDSTGMSASWFLDRVIVTDMNRPHLRFFYACNNWLSRDEGDGLTVRYLLGSLNPMDIPKQNKYIASVFTMDAKGSGTDADVYLSVFGEFGDTGERKLASDGKDNFERGNEDKFTIEAPNLGRLRKITIGHNNKGSSAGWACDKVVVDDMGNKEVYDFPVNAWFDISEGDGKIQRDVLAGATQPMSIVYNVQVMTGDIRGAGTNSKIHFVMHGRKGIKNSGKLFLEGGTFERAQIDIFNVELLELLSPLSRVTIGHDNAGISCGWYCEKVTVYCPFTGLEQVFPCGRWLDEDEGDGLVERELYEMVSLRQKKQKKFPWSLWIWTSEIKGAGTDAQVFLQVYGEKGKSDEMKLESKSDSFEQGQCDKFIIEMADIGKIRKLRIWHEKRNPFSGWHLGRVTLMKTLTREKCSFVCNRWLDINEDDNEIVRELPATGKLVPEALPLIKYRVTICTGNISGSGTDASVYLNIIGDLGDTGERLMFMSKNNANKFEKGNHDEFLVEAVNLGLIRRVRIGHDGRGGGCGWFLDKVMIREEGQPEASSIEFPCYRWLDRNEDDGQIVRELVPTDDGQRLFTVGYHIAIKTGSINGASSDSKVFVKLYGEKGDTNKMLLVVSDNDLVNYFETGQTDIFTIETFDIGNLIGHTNEGLRAGWFLDSVQIWVSVHGVQYMFPSHRWLCKDEADGKVEVEIYPSETLEIEKLINYEVTVVTDAGTDANVYAILYGTKDDTGIINLKASKNHRNKFELGLIDEFTIEAVDIGKLKRIRIGHDNAGVSPGWFLDWVEIDAPSLGQLLRFPCGRWLDKGKDDGAIDRDLYPNELQTVLYTPFVPYEIKIFTSDIFAAGTDADVFIILYGQNGVCTSQKSLCVNKRERRMYFERGAEDMFIVELEDIGDIIEKIRIGHDNRGVNPGWHLDRVEIRRLLRKGKGSETAIFPCEGWLARSEEDGETIRELVPSDIIVEKLSRDGTLKVIETEVDDALEIHTYTMAVTTGDVYGAGTDANVFITLYGDMGDTGERKLSKSENSNKFERGSVDTFTLEAVDLGQVFKIRVRHDNSMLSADWYLDQVEVVDQDTEEVFLFLCERWLSRKKEDKRIDRVFYVKGYEGERETAFCPIKKVTNLDSNMNKKNKKRHSEKEDDEGSLIPYHFSVTTGLDRDAGTSIIPYHFSVTTGLDRDAGTSSRVYVIIIGKKNKKTEHLWLDLDGKNGFMPGSLDYFTCFGTDVGDIKKVELGHDGATPESCWLVEELTVEVPTKAVRYLFPCKCWLAKDRGDGLTARFLDVQDAETVNIPQKVIYEVTVITGDVQHAGTDTQIYMTVFGVYGTSEEMLLPKLEDRFERGQKDTFNLEIEDIASLRKMRVRIDGSGSRPDWFLDKIELHNLQTDEVALFTYEEWLSRSYGPKRTLLCEMPAVINDEEMVELTTYTVSVKTSDVTAAGTDANLWMIIFGENGDTGTLTLKESNNTNKFERKQMDTFRFSDILSLGELSKVRIWHDNSVLAAGWHLEYVDVHDDILEKKFRFQCDRWLAKNEGDGQIMRELACANNDAVDFDEKTKYEILVTTADADDAETKENAWIVLEGKKGRSKEFMMENSTKKKRFLRGASDRFEFSSKELGDIASICLGHIPKDGKKVKAEASWFAEEVVVTEKELGNKYIFRCDTAIPLSSKRDEFQTFECSKFIESFTSKAQSLVPVKYELIVITGDDKGAGTDANVFITIFGSNGDSGQRQLTKKFQNLFERGQTNRFILELLDLGDLLRMHVEHDNSGLSPGWLLSRIEITNTANAVTTIFICGKWLDKNKADGKIKRVIYPKY
ncbi:LOW QUALITY PROTEIN: lipoxygenase homology domain-containing protein 1-like [Sinocyclocheilus grahami]|uniref:LOW QUALITY PROTEIN: lipoxygenase homology domain-containing protein 1-like n=1 Tax=Sinocyclocheilus grahami TaxID=75366 RepID=UPI0007AC873B|nr:PREDICTED: LOW QUALITY PROTEIN: lipoxygenase homology domain-containing protein 1-like [Sinocyclocheilus grahami]